MDDYVFKKFLNSTAGGHESSNLSEKVRKSPRTKKRNDTLKKLIRSRKLRRSNRQTKDFFEIDIDASTISNLADGFLNKCFIANYQKLVSEKSSSIECYHIILNSLNRCFSMRDSTSTLNVVNEYLKKLIQNNLLFTDGRPQSPDQLNLTNKPCRISLETIIILELHLLRCFPQPLCKTKIVSRLRLLYFATDPLTFKNFTDEIICDEFIDDLALYLAAIYAELELEKPSDLRQQTFQEEYNSSQVDDVNNNALADKLKEFLAEDPSEIHEEQSAVLHDHNINNKKSKRTKYSLRIMPQLHKNKNRSPNKSPLKQHKLRRPKKALNTPAGKRLRNNTNKNIEVHNDEIIEQTPIGKIRRMSYSNEAKKISDLLKHEEAYFESIPPLPSPSSFPPISNPHEQQMLQSLGLKDSSGSASTSGPSLENSLNVDPTETKSIRKKTTALSVKSTNSSAKRKLLFKNKGSYSSSIVTSNTFPFLKR